MSMIVLWFGCSAHRDTAIERGVFQGEMGADSADALVEGTVPSVEFGRQLWAVPGPTGQWLAFRRENGGYPVGDASYVGLATTDVLVRPPAGTALVGGEYSGQYTTGSGAADVTVLSTQGFDSTDASWGCWCIDVYGVPSLWISEPRLEDGTAVFGSRLFPGFDVGATQWAAIVVGDTDADGFTDLVVGARDLGWGYFIPGSADAAASMDEAIVFADEDHIHRTYHVSAAGDTDGDGISEYAVGGVSVGGDEGAVRLIQGHPAPDLIESAGLLATIGGEQEDYLVAGGYGTVRGVSDNDNDGYDDILIGATADPGSDGYPAKFLTGIFHGPISGQLAFSDADITLRGADESDPLATADHVSGDFDGDGRTDLLLGRHLFLGPIAASGYADDLDSAYFVDGEDARSIDDFDGDGIDDIAVGEPSYTGTADDGIDVYGRVQIWYGR